MRKQIQRWLPKPASLKANPALHFLGDLLEDPNLFHLNRRSVSLALFWGCFIALLPMPGQMAVAALAAWYFRCNLPICCALAWLSNPFTLPFFLVICYTAGRWCLGLEAVSLSLPEEWSWQWLAAELPNYFYPIVLPFLLGSLLVGLGLGSSAYLIAQLAWRWHTLRSWRARRTKRGH